MLCGDNLYLFIYIYLYLSELTRISHSAEKPTLKDVIQIDTALILEKIESLNNIFREPLETSVSWTKMPAMNHKKDKYKERRFTGPFQVISDC
jgi:hypothetical protein